MRNKKLLSILLLVFFHFTQYQVLEAISVYLTQVLRMLEVEAVYSNLRNVLRSIWETMIRNIRRLLGISSLNKADIYGRYCLRKAEVDFINMNRLLWLQHVNWTRMTIISIVFNLPDLTFVQERLLRNATDMGNSLRPFYGDEIADAYTELIKEHLSVSGGIGNGSCKGRYGKWRQKKRKQWYRNADDIAAFLSSINPYLGERRIKEDVLYAFKL